MIYILLERGLIITNPFRQLLVKVLLQEKNVFFLSIETKTYSASVVSAGLSGSTKLSSVILSSGEVASSGAVQAPNVVTKPRTKSMGKSLIDWKLMISNPCCSTFTSILSTIRLLN